MDLERLGKPIGEGTSWVLQRKGKWLGMNGFSLGRHAEVYDAEAMDEDMWRTRCRSNKSNNRISIEYPYTYVPARTTSTLHNKPERYPKALSRMVSKRSKYVYRMQKTGGVKDGKSRFNRSRPTTGIKGKRYCGR